MWRLFEAILPGGNTRIMFAKTRMDVRRLLPDVVKVNEIIIKG